jgi:hypothetical protein
LAIGRTLVLDPLSKPKNVLKDYGIEYSEASTSSDSDSDIDDDSSEDADSESVEGEKEDEDGNNSDDSDIDANEIPPVSNAISRTLPKQIRKPKGAASRATYPRYPRIPALPSQTHGIKHSRSTSIDHTTGPSKKKRREKEDAFREARSDLREDTYDYNRDLSNDDHDGGIFGGMFGWMGGGDFTQHRRKEEFAFCMGWE